jgi:hypothetical protein
VLWIESGFLILGLVRFLIFCKDKSFEIRSIEHMIKLLTLFNYVTGGRYTDININFKMIFVRKKFWPSTEIEKIYS